MKKVLALALSLALIATMAISTTVAYLTSEDSDVNVMTLGNVKIEQHEYQRAVGEDGAYTKETIDDQNSYVLEDFEQAKPLLPIVGDPSLPSTDPGYAGYDTIPVRMSQVDSYGGMDVFAGKNAQDKFVTVENTGKSDAYVRTIVAIEFGSIEDTKLIRTSYHFTWDEEVIGVVEINGIKYGVWEYVYEGAQLNDGSWRHEDGILPAGDTTYPNLSQVYLSSKATNEDMEKIDGNGNGTLDILVLSQAVQAAGFADAETALKAAFGEATAENVADWFEDMEIPTYVSTLKDVEAALAEGGKVVLSDDISIPDGEQINMPAGSTATLDLNGKTITSPAQKYAIRNEGNLTITGGGTIEGKFGAFGNYGSAVAVIEDVTLISNGYTGNSSHAIYTSGNSFLTLNDATVQHNGGGADGSVLYAAGSSTVEINGNSSFTWAGSAYNLAAAGTSTVTINGATFQNDNFFNWGGTITDNRSQE